MSIIYNLSIDKSCDIIYLIDILRDEKLRLKKIPQLPPIIEFPPKPPPENPSYPNNGNDDPPRKTPAGASAIPETSEESEPLDVYSKERVA